MPHDHWQDLLELLQRALGPADLRHDYLKCCDTRSTPIRATKQVFIMGQPLTRPGWQPSIDMRKDHESGDGGVRPSRFYNRTLARVVSSFGRYRRSYFWPLSDE